MKSGSLIQRQDGKYFHLKLFRLIRKLRAGTIRDRVDFSHEAWILEDQNPSGVRTTQGQDANDLDLTVLNQHMSRNISKVSSKRPKRIIKQELSHIPARICVLLIGAWIINHYSLQ